MADKVGVAGGWVGCRTINELMCAIFLHPSGQEHIVSKTTEGVLVPFFTPALLHLALFHIHSGIYHRCYPYNWRGRRVQWKRCI